MFLQYFHIEQSILLCLSAIFLILALYFQTKEKNKYVYISLFCSALCLYSFAALLDPFINLWDERYHALVAQNLIKHPFKPTLYDNTILPISYDGWGNGHIWLHKQPFFLWQMALSMAIFGENTFALRLPDIIICSCIVLVLYRIGILVSNAKIGFLSAVLFMCSFYVLSLVSGRKELEHNDIAFLGYVTFSIWVLIEYQISKQKNWIYLIGMFAGMAILCKWLVGLLVYAGWFVIKCYDREFQISKQKDIFISILITIAVALPWQLYTFWAFPAEAAKEMAYNSQHLFHVVEGHGGDVWYHLERMKEMNGSWIWFALPISIYLTIKKINEKKIAISLIFMILIVYLFFTFAATKMPSFTLITFPWICFILSVSIFASSQYFPKFSINTSFLASIVLIIMIRFDFNKLIENFTHKKANFYAGSMEYNKIILQELDLQENEVLFNVQGGHFVEAMFYTKRIVYPFIPNEKQVKILQEKGFQAVVMIENGEIPEFLLKSPLVRIIKKQIKVLDS